MNNTIKRRKGSRWTHEAFVARVKELHGDEYTVLSQFETTMKKVTMKHNVCGNVYEMLGESVVKGRQCTPCIRKKAGLKNAKRYALTNSEFVERVNELVGNEYTFLEEYKRSNIKIKVKHNKCGHIYEVAPNRFTQGRRCPKCRYKNLGEKVAKKTRTSQAEFENKIKSLVGEEYTFVDSYKNATTPINVRHNNCGKIYKVSPTNFYRCSRCPNCESYVSTGERKIEEYLINNDIGYETQFTIEGCMNKHLLPFDFAIIQKGELKLLIEYDGEQHFKPIEIFGGEERYLYTKKNDEIKKKFCEDNNIPLLEIPYWEKENIPNILKQALN